VFKRIGFWFRGDDWLDAEIVGHTSKGGWEVFAGEPLEDGETIAVFRGEAMIANCGPALVDVGKAESICTATLRAWMVATIENVKGHSAKLG
jgi:hypothetical protein